MCDCPFCKAGIDVDKLVELTAKYYRLECKREEYAKSWNGQAWVKE